MGYIPFTPAEAEAARRRALDEPTLIYKEIYPNGFGQCIRDQKLKGNVNAGVACEALISRGATKDLIFTAEERAKNLTLDFLTSPTPAEAASEELRSLEKRTPSGYTGEVFVYNLPALPGLGLPGFPEVPKFDLGLTKYIFLFILVIIALIAIGYSGIGKIVEREHGRRRGRGRGKGRANR